MIRIIKKNNFFKVSSRRNTSSGFFMMYAVLFASIMLVIGMGIIDIVLRQVAFSGVGKESGRAFYAADAGMECALYGDIVLGVFTTGAVPTTLNCNGNTVSLPPTNTPNFSFNFWINKNNPQERSCAFVTLSRTLDSLGEIATTTVSSLGYNTECPNIGAPTRFPFVERGVKGAY